MIQIDEPARAALIAQHRAIADTFRCKEPDRSEKHGSKYIIGFADWYGKPLPAVLNTETGLTSKPMSRTLAQRLCCSRQRRPRRRIRVTIR